MILKTTFNDGQVVFEDLSDKIILTSKQRSPEKFNHSLHEWFKKDDPIAKDCYGFISVLRLETSDIPLYTDMGYSLLSERGCEVMKIGIGNL